MRLSVDRGLVVAGVEFEICDAERVAEQLAGTPQLRFEPRNQFLQRERFDEIVIGSAAQALNAILQPAPGGQNQHRDRIVSMPKLAQELKTVAVGQSESRMSAA